MSVETRAERAPRRRPSQRLADSFARAASRSSPRARAVAMRGPVGRLLTAQIFRGMAREFQPEKAKGLDAVMLWEVGADGERVERWQLTIRDQRCRAGRPTGEAPALTLRLDRATLLELATGLANPPQLFITGRLKISGDLMLAQRLTTLFRIPKARASTGAQSAKSST